MCIFAVFLLVAYFVNFSFMLSQFLGYSLPWIIDSCINDGERSMLCLGDKLSLAAGKIDPSFVITHTLPLKDAAHGYKVFNDKKENCIKVVLKPEKA